MPANITPAGERPSWVLLTFALSASRASERVQIWRRLRRHGALPLKSGGHLLPNSPSNLEHFQWIAAAVRKVNGHASIIQTQSIDDLSEDRLKAMFIEARTRDYEALVSQLKKARPSSKRRFILGHLRRKFQEIAATDFFNSPLRSRVESLLAHTDDSLSASLRTKRPAQKDRLHARTWLTRPRPGIDRVASAWLIRRFIDADAKFVFDNNSNRYPGAIPFDMFTAAGFGHRGDDCTFETLCKEFDIRDPKVRAIAQIIHDADLEDEKFGRIEGVGLDRALIGWAQQGIEDQELLRRGIELIEGLYNALP